MRLFKYATLLAALALPGAALAFCGGFNDPVAMGFDHGSWGEKWQVLAAILGGIGLFSALVMRQWRLMRELPAEEI